MSTARTSPIATSEVRVALEHGLGGRVAEIRRRPSVYASSCILEEVSVGLPDGRQLEFVLKDLSPAGVLDSSAGIKPSCVMDPVREIETYRLILAGKFGTATCYATGIHPGEQRYWLLLEAVQGVELYQIGDIEIWRSVARWLAELHAWGSTVYAATATAAHLLDHTASFYRRWMQRALTHAPRGTQLAAMRWLADRHERVIEQIVALPKTFIHGECYASNVLVQARPTLRVCPIDWEMAALGPGLMDLAALSSGTWTLAERDVIAEAYCQTLRRIDSGSLGARDFSAALDCCRFQLAVQWLGWSTGWQPPPQHATNWLGEALSAADRLGL